MRKKNPGRTKSESVSCIWPGSEALRGVLRRSSSETGRTGDGEGPHRTCMAGVQQEDGRVPSALVVLEQPTTRCVRRAVDVPPRHGAKLPYRKKCHEPTGGIEAWTAQSLLPNLVGPVSPKILSTLSPL